MKFEISAFFPRALPECAILQAQMMDFMIGGFRINLKLVYLNNSRTNFFFN